MRLGVFDILPRNALDRLTAEDLRLLLNGTGEIDVDVLASYTTFHNETGASSTDVVKSVEGVDGVARLKRWFWITVRNMNNKQRQDLVSNQCLFSHFPSLLQLFIVECDPHHNGENIQSHTFILILIEYENSWHTDRLIRSRLLNSQKRISISLCLLNSSISGPLVQLCQPVHKDSNLCHR